MGQDTERAVTRLSVDSLDKTEQLAELLAHLVTVHARLDELRDSTASTFADADRRLRLVSEANAYIGHAVARLGARVDVLSGSSTILQGKYRAEEELRHELREELTTLLNRVDYVAGEALDHAEAAVRLARATRQDVDAVGADLYKHRGRARNRDVLLFVVALVPAIVFAVSWLWYGVHAGIVR
jgi:chromosome segregation ATPase